jgi:hypothetical protein
VAVNCGHVYILRLHIAAKDKLVVPAFIEADGRVRFFVINTERTDFQIARPEVAKHVLPLKAKANGNFLTHDSWLACHEIIGGWKVPEIEAIQGCQRGPLDQATLAAVASVIKVSRLHSEADKAAILDQWPS